MLISAQKILSLIQNSFGNLINIFRVCVLALSLSTSPLLAEAYTLCLFINDIFMYRLLATTVYSFPAEIILTIFGKEVLTGNFPDG